MPHRVACVQMTSTHDLNQNLQNAKKWVEDASLQGADLVVLPEMFAIMGMDESEKLKYREELGHGQIQDFLAETALQQEVWIIGGTIPLLSQTGEKVRAACLVYNDKGERVGRYDKYHLFDVKLPDGKSFFESHTIEPGEDVVVIPTPFGNLGLAVCYDVRFPELFRKMHDQGVEIIAIPSAFTFVTGALHWEILVRSRAIENLAYVLAACQTGSHPNGRKTYGHSMIVNPWGEVKACLPKEEGVIVSEIHLDYLHQLRQDFPALLHKRL